MSREEWAHCSELSAHVDADYPDEKSVWCNDIGRGVRPCVFCTIIKVNGCRHTIDMTNLKDRQGDVTRMKGEQQVDMTYLI